MISAILARLRVFGFALVSLTATATSPIANAATIEYPNIEVQTLGGPQFWQDTYVHAQWRIQKNIITGHSRLLDPDDVRMAWGDTYSCFEKFSILKKSHKIQPSSSHLVILLHGIARSTGTFSKMKKALTAQGYDSVVLSYPSTRATIEEHAKALSGVLNRLKGTQTISFVTHSMGGLVLRQILATDSAWKEKIEIGRIVMIAPPNQGSALARALKNSPLYKMIYGDAGQQLTPETVAGIAKLKAHQFAVIAGGQADGKGFNPFLDGDDDGTVKVSETHLAGAKDQMVVAALHAFISDHPTTIRATINFLKYGQFDLLK